MNFEKARVITEEAVKQAVEMAGQCGCACHDPAEDVKTHGLCAATDCACEIMSDCACELYDYALECNDC